MTPSQTKSRGHRRGRSDRLSLSHILLHRCDFKMPKNPDYVCPRYGEMYDAIFEVWYCPFHDRHSKERCNAFSNYQGIRCPEMGLKADAETGRKYCKAHDPTIYINPPLPPASNEDPKTERAVDNKTASGTSSQTKPPERAVHNKTASGTLSHPKPPERAVHNKTASGALSHTKPPERAVHNKTASGTLSHTKPPDRDPDSVSNDESKSTPRTLTKLANEEQNASNTSSKTKALLSTPNSFSDPEPQSTPSTRPSTTRPPPITPAAENNRVPRLDSLSPITPATENNKVPRLDSLSPRSSDRKDPIKIKIPHVFTRNFSFPSRSSPSPGPSSSSSSPASSPLTEATPTRPHPRRSLSEILIKSVHDTEPEKNRISATYVQCNICMEQHDTSVMHQLDICGHQYRPLCLAKVVRNGIRRRYNCSSCRAWMVEMLEGY